MLCAAVVRDDCLFVLRLEGVELASEFAQCRLGVAKAEGARLFERAERGGDAGQGGFVGRNVEICYCMGDELEQKSASRTSWTDARLGVLLLQGLRQEAWLWCGICVRPRGIALTAQ